MPEPTPGQTVGPFFGYSLPYPGGPDLVGPAHPGAIRLHGRVLDGAGAPVPDAVLEIQQADTDGVVVAQPGSLSRDGWTFTGWGRAATDATGHYSFRTVVPGAPGGAAAFVAMAVFARGLLDRLFTRVYLPGDESVFAGDALLASLPPGRRRTLMATPEPDGFAFDVVLQGSDAFAETVFIAHTPHA